MEVYNKAVKIDTSDMFEYGMRTNVGNAFVYGTLEAVDTVTYPELGGEYMYIKKVKEKYTKHTRTVTKTKTVNGKTQTYTEEKEYWTWGRCGSEDKMCDNISFCGTTFSSSKIDIPNATYIDTIKESSHIRYRYYGTGTSYNGTIFTELEDNTISSNSPFYNGMSIDETIDKLDTSIGNIEFWIVWVVATGLAVFGFFYLENKWLE